MNGFFLAIVMALQPTTAPQIVAPFETERDCRTAAVKANALPELKKPEAQAQGAMFICLSLVAD